MTVIKGTKTEQNLLKAFAGESQARNRYTYFSSVAKKEGFMQIADIFEETANHEKEHAKTFEAISIAEKQHEKRYLGLLSNVLKNEVFQKKETVVWRCRNCGYLHAGKSSPENCQACLHPQAYFELLIENW